MATARFWIGLLALCVAGAPAEASTMTLLCRLRQTGGGHVTDFVRRLEINEAAKTVAIADDLGRGFQPLPLDGMLVRSDQSEVVFEYVDAVSIGRSVFRWHSGRYRLRDGKFVTRGKCGFALPDLSPTTATR